MSDGAIWAFNRDREIMSLNDSKSAGAVLSALTTSCRDVVDTVFAKAHGSMITEATIPWSAVMSDMFDGIGIVNDGLAIRLEDCMEK
jgi:hypothetical protein